MLLCYLSTPSGGADLPRGMSCATLGIYWNEIRANAGTGLQSGDFTHRRDIWLLGERFPAEFMCERGGAAVGRPGPTGRRSGDLAQQGGGRETWPNGAAVRRPGPTGVLIRFYAFA